jgi:hypothetical protein
VFDQFHSESRSFSILVAPIAAICTIPLKLGFYVARHYSPIQTRAPTRRINLAERITLAALSEPEEVNALPPIERAGSGIVSLAK